MATRVLRSIESRLPGRFKEFSGYAGTRRALLLPALPLMLDWSGVSAVGASGLIPVAALHSPAPAVFSPSHGRGFSLGGARCHG